MKISVFAILVSSFLGAVQANVSALDSARIGTLGHDKNASGSIEVSDVHRRLASEYEIVNGEPCNSISVPEADRCCHLGDFTSFDGCGAITGEFEVGKGSCLGLHACMNSNGYLKIGRNSCINGYFICTYSAKDGGYAEIGDNSCIEDVNEVGEACQGIGMTNGKAVIGKDSCHGLDSCHGIGRSTTGGTFIGDRSCNGHEACNRIGSNSPSQLKIGSDACNCKHCCKCLTPGDIVPDGKCNTLGNGPGQCCESDKVKNSSFDSSGIITDPTPPGGTAPPTASPIFAGAPVFDIELDTCSFTESSDGIHVGDISCTFNTKGGNDHSVRSAIYNNDCSSPAPPGVTQDANPTFALVSGSQESSTYDVTISLTSAAVPSGATSVNFCLMTEVMGSDGAVYDWTGQKIALAVDVDGTFGSFSTSDLTTSTFIGNTNDAEDAGTTTFTVHAFRCDSTGVGISNNVLSFGENFYLCVVGHQSAVIIEGITNLKVSKPDVSTDINLITSGTNNANTFVYGAGTNEVVIATLLPAQFFVTSEAITLYGGASIVTGGGGRQLVRIERKPSVLDSADFSMEVEVEASGVISTSIFGSAAAALVGFVAALVL